VRDPDQWFDSTQATIFSPESLVAQTLRTGQGDLLDFFSSFIGPIREHLHDRAFMTEHFRRHTEAVKAAIPSERLLVYEAGQGWEPLCTFLGAPIPDAPYPAENNRAEFAARLAGVKPGELERT
jgi:hypothetical protein